MRTWSTRLLSRMLIIPLSNSRQENPSCNCFPLESKGHFGILMEKLDISLIDSFISFCLSFWFIHTFTDNNWVRWRLLHEPLGFCLPVPMNDKYFSFWSENRKSILWAGRVPKNKQLPLGVITLKVGDWATLSLISRLQKSFNGENSALNPSQL